ncbi:MAG: flagellar biosynthetic protein FliO [Candidatus Symbiobacter sp.]|nr:flagellar biosynthetic protein FliO [Candidatus Symbiobacter sp.]
MDIGNYSRYLFALVLVLVLIWVVGRILPKLNLGSKFVPMSKRRLALVESMMLDTKSRLVLVRRDDREHLLLLTLGQTGLVVEGGILPKPSASDPLASPAATTPAIASAPPAALPPGVVLAVAWLKAFEKSFAFITAKSLGLSRLVKIRVVRYWNLLKESLKK